MPTPVEPAHFNCFDCDPGALAIVVSDFGWALPIFAAAAFVAGVRLSRSSVALPAFCLAAIGAGFLSTFHLKIDAYRRTMGSDFSAADQTLLRAMSRGIIQDYAVGSLAFVALPFAAGLLVNAFKQRKMKRPHAQN